MRWRRWLIGSGIAVVLATAGGGVVTWFLHSRSLIGMFENGFRNRLPGELSIGSITYLSHDVIELSEVAISGPAPLLGRRPQAIARIATVRVHMDWRTAHPTWIELLGTAIHLDHERLLALQHIIEAEARVASSSGGGSGPSVPSPAMRITAQGEGRLGEAIAIRDIAVSLTATGPRFKGVGTATVAGGDGVGRPLRLSFETLDRAGARAFAYTVDEAVVQATSLVDAATQLGLVPEPGPGARAWIDPIGLVDGRGTVIISEPGQARFSGTPRLTWNGGRLACTWALDQARLELTSLQIDDPSVLRFEGRLQADLLTNQVHVQSSAWAPGPRLQIPAQVPVADLLTLLPRLDLVADLHAARIVLSFQGRGQAWLRMETTPGSPLRLTGGELPLSLAIPFIPPWLVVNGGLASDGAGGTAMSLSIGNAGLEGIVLDLRQARIGAGVWSLGPVDGRLRLRPATAGWAVGLETLGGGASWTPTTDGGRITLELPAIEPLVARLQGALELPDLRGAIATEATIAVEAGTWRVVVERLKLRRAEMPDLLRAVDIDARGRVTWTAAKEELAISGEGRLSGGRLRLPGLWVDVAQRSPLATIAARLTTVGTDRELTIDRLLARATGPGGQLLAGGWSAELGGRLRLRSGLGTVTGAIDHADLGWLIARLPGADPRMVGGEGACTFTALFKDRRLERVDGAVLPLAASLDLGNALRITGITGAVGFTLVP